MTQFLNLTIAGLAVAGLLFMVSVGLSLIFGLLGVLNFAHGAFFLWGAYIWFQAYFFGVNLFVYHIPAGNFWVALGAATLSGAVLGFATERIFLRSLYQKPLSQILVTLGLGLVLTQLVIAVWGVTPLPAPPPPFLSGTINMSGTFLPEYWIFVIAIGAVTLLAIGAVMRFTRIGLIVRAGVENPTMVRALGINVSLVFMSVFTVGAALAALGGAVYAPHQFVVSPDMGQTTLFAAIIVVVLGGLGSVPGSAVGALVIGLAQEYVPYYLQQLSLSHPFLGSWVGSSEALISLLLLVVVLLVRPQGLLGSVHQAGAL